MTNKLPPLNSLKAFEAAARNLSFTQAAKELFVTQGAISKQMKLLESFLGKELFLRTTKGLILTDEAYIYYKQIKTSLLSIEDATENILKQSSQQQTITLNVLPSLAKYILIPKLNEINEAYANLNIRINTGDNVKFDFDNLQADVVIRVNNKEFKKMVNLPLMQERMLLVCAVGFIKQDFKIDDISNFQLLEHNGRPRIWEEWLKSYDINPKSRNKLIFEHFYMIIDAVKKRLGFAFVPDFMVQSEIDNKNIINPLDISLITDYKYYILYRQNEERDFVKHFANDLQRTS